MIPEIFQKLGIALGLGLLVGLQRERAESKIGGIRTFPLITLLGALCALLSAPLGGWTIAGGFLALAAVVIIANITAMRSGEHDIGQTTEIAALLMYAVGAYVMVGHVPAAVAVGGVVAVLLHFKDPLHRFVRSLGDQDALAIMQFVLISLVILPVLPDRYYGPGTFDVWNPRKIWMMVVLIVGISLAGYVAYKLLGKNAGTFLGGILGGLISSTATTVSYSRRARHNPGAASLAAIVIVVASAVSMGRVIVEIGAVAPGIFGLVAPPIIAMCALMLLISMGAYFFGHTEKAQLPEQGNPAELKSALVFAALYAVVLLAVALAQRYFGHKGLYVVGVLSGLTDMDAITLSTAQLAARGATDTTTAWRVILLAALSNLVFKGGTVLALSNRALGMRVSLLFGIGLLGGLFILFFWPPNWTLGAISLPTTQPTP